MIPGENPAEFYKRKLKSRESRSRMKKPTRIQAQKEDDDKDPNIHSS
jgi:hypothetical protein